ncbi:MAG: hypothetical protein NT149_01855 [Candidatus Gottesmanbacteria bacterium]|nr:hypothetical protein [Candidatus Gottesmanbacteria bacterium]
MKNNIVLIAILALIVGSGAGFFAGSQYQKSQQPSFGQFAGAGLGARGGSAPAGARGRNGNGAAGTILSVDTNSMTVKLADGGSKIVLLTRTTSINKTATATASDLTVGETVSAFGTTNTDGSITAGNVQINPVIRGPGYSSGASGPATP